MRGRVRRDPHIRAEHAFCLEAADGFAVALVGVQAHHLHGGHLPIGLLVGPLLQVSGITAVEHVHDLAGAGVDRRGHEPAPPPSRRR